MSEDKQKNAPCTVYGVLPRECRFRVWDKDKKQMSPVAEISFGDDGSALTIVVQPAPKGPYYRGLVAEENAVLLQCIGYTDKNGKDIYQGDILQDWRGVRQEVVAFVEAQYVLSGWMLRPLREPDVPVGGYAVATTNWLRVAEVIGNIYEQPELAGKGA